MVAIWVIKLSALLVIFVTALLFGLIPFKLFGYLSTNQAERAWAQTIIAALNCGAGGIFLGTTFLDLLPEVREGFESIWSEKDLGELHFPLAEFVVIIGFFFVVFLEHSILTCQAKCIKGRKQGKSITESDQLQNGFSKTSGYGSITTFIEHENQQSPGATENMNKDQDSECSQCNELPLSIEKLDLNEAGFQRQNDSAHMKGAGSLLLLLALSVHTIFEGLALGLLENSAQIWQLTFAIALHKSVIVFSLGLRIAEEIDSVCRGVCFIVGFSLVCPVGAGIGTLISETSANSFSMQVISTVLQGIATGTFLQVTFFEVLYKEIGERCSLIKVFATLVGFLLMAVLVFFLHA